MVAVQFFNDLRRVLDDDGNVIEGAKVPDIPEQDLRRLFDRMLMVRVVDERMMRLQRQGRLGFYLKSIGEEASHFAVYPLTQTDWVLPSYREHGAWFWRGYPVETYINQLFGNERDPVKGRQMPVHHTDRGRHLVSISSPVGTQIPQAVGVAHAAKICRSKDVVMTYFGEGATSTGAFHVSMNFAGVFKLPIVLVCRNNGWAISVPTDKQTAATSYAAKAVAYGMPGVLVDGNDVLAVIQVAREAVDRARRGEGPTLIEARTYRRQGHSSSDDPSVYRDPQEPEIWERRDPVHRFRNYLKHIGLWTQHLEQEINDKHNAEVTRVLQENDALGTHGLETMFEDVYEKPTWNLEEQRAYLFAQKRVKSPHSH